VIEHVDIAIVGAGPAGTAAALQVAALPEGRRARVALIDAAFFPRPKLCGGGITARTEELLASLGVEGSVPAVDIHEVRFVFRDRTESQTGSPSFRVIRRDEFDAMLVEEACRRGAILMPGDAVRSLSTRGDAVVVELASGRMLQASIVIGADGANSIVRRRLVPESVHAAPFIALEVLTPGHDPGASQRAIFDFRSIQTGIRGYTWDFPSMIDGREITNRGICAIGEVPQRTLKHAFSEALAMRGIDLEACKLEGAWAPVYDPRRVQSSPRVLLAGDAVGIDPWLGEGISSAIGSGIIAGHMAVRALATGEVEFADYRERILRSTVGQGLLRNLLIAQSFYRPDEDAVATEMAQ
jgi:flavin-dependent dehydrogenase